MKFTPTRLPDAVIVELDKFEDSRGFFARTWCSREFKEQGLSVEMVQSNVSFNREKGTLRGLHMQEDPHGEDKLVRCTRGSIYDVAVDMRIGSDTYLQWIGVELTERNYRMLYVPKGFAHGFITLEDDTEVTYQVSQYYTPSSERGLRYDDPSLKIKWPIRCEVISEKDASWPLLTTDHASKPRP